MQPPAGPTLVHKNGCAGKEKPHFTCSVCVWPLPLPLELASSIVTWVSFSSSSPQKKGEFIRSLLQLVSNCQRAGQRFQVTVLLSRSLAKHRQNAVFLGVCRQGWSWADDHQIHTSPTHLIIKYLYYDLGGPEGVHSTDYIYDGFLSCLITGCRISLNHLWEAWCTLATCNFGFKVHGRLSVLGLQAWENKKIVWLSTRDVRKTLWKILNFFTQKKAGIIFILIS